MNHFSHGSTERPDPPARTLAQIETSFAARRRRGVGIGQDIRGIVSSRQLSGCRKDKYCLVALKGHEKYAYRLIEVVNATDGIYETIVSWASLNGPSRSTSQRSASVLWPQTSGLGYWTTEWELVRNRCFIETARGLPLSLYPLHSVLSAESCGPTTTTARKQKLAMLTEAKSITCALGLPTHTD